VTTDIAQLLPDLAIPFARATASKQTFGPYSQFTGRTALYTGPLGNERSHVDIIRKLIPAWVCNAEARAGIQSASCRNAPNGRPR
jgi:hypothetical protein